MHRAAAFCFTLLLAGASIAAPPELEIPAEIKAVPGKWLVVAPKTNAKAVLFVGLDALEAFPSAELRDPRKLIVQAPLTAGRWRFVAVGTLGDELTQTAFVVVVGDAPPVPPVPPTPPAPPSDPLSQALATAWAKEPAGPAKAGNAAFLASIYKQQAACVRDPGAYKTVGDLVTVTHKAIQDYLSDGMAFVRRAVADAMSADFPSSPATVLDAPLRQRFADFFTRASTVLGGLK